MKKLNILEDVIKIIDNKIKENEKYFLTKEGTKDPMCGICDTDGYCYHKIVSFELNDVKEKILDLKVIQI